MKMKKFGLLITAAVIFTVILATASFAADFVFTQHKVVISHDSSDDTIYADIYISKGSAMVGYCSFTYNPDVLQLKDIYSKPVTAGNVPEFGQNGNIYLTDIITGHNSVIITDVGKGTPTLVNPEEGYFMFAWLLPDDTVIRADENNEVLIASLSFDLITDISYEEFDKDIFWVADNETTDLVKDWHPGIVVMNAEQHQFNFDGTVEDGDLFILEYQLDTLRQSADDPIEETEDEPAVEPDDEPAAKPEDEPAVEPEDEPAAEPEDEPAAEPEDEPAAKPDDEDEVEDDTSSTLLNKNASFRADFNLEYTKDASSIHLSWQAPDNLKKISNYTAVLCDSDYNVIKSVDIFNASTSYTFKGIREDFSYIVYFYANVSDKTYCSELLNIKTDADANAELLFSTVTYNAGKGAIYGFKSEQVLFGDCITKLPKVTPPKDMYFIGWTVDGENVFDTSSRIYKDIKLTALYSDSPKVLPSSYITGYLDGTFKPDGSITRAEAAVLISRISPLFDADTKYEHSFSDCENGAWYENAVAFCSSNGFITGYLNGTFNPSGKITRAEFATILVRVFGFDDAKEINVFTDIDSHWACPYIARLFCAGIITPDTEGRFNPSAVLTRKDAVLLLNACLDITPDVAAINKYLENNGYKFTDVEQYKDYFYPIMAATLKAEDYND